MLTACARAHTHIPTRTHTKQQQAFTVLVDGSDKSSWAKPVSGTVAGADAHDGGFSQKLFSQLSVGAAEFDAVTPLPCCPVRDSKSNQLQLGLTVQVTSVQPLQSAAVLLRAAAGGADANSTTSCVAEALIGATLTVRVAHDLGAAAQLTVVLR